MSGHRYSVTAAVAPELPLRVLNLFAQQALVVDVAAVVRRGERYEIDVAIADLADRSAAIIAEKLRAMVLVERVGLERYPSAPG